MRLRVRATSRSFNILCPATVKPDSGTPRYESRLVTPGTSLRIGYQDGWHGTQMSGILAYTSSAGNQGIEVAFTGAHLGSCQPGNDAGALRGTTRDYKSTRCRTSPDPRQRVRTSWSRQPLLCHTPDITAVTVERAVGAERCCGLAAPSQQLQILLSAADSNKRPSPLHTRSLVPCAVSCMHRLSGGHRLNTLARGGSRVRASCTVPRLRVRRLGFE